MLSVTVDTSEAGGGYAPDHVLAIWIEDSNGDFVRTLLAYAANRRTHLNRWQASSKAAGVEYSNVDGISGATKSSHKTRSATWDAQDFLGAVVPDGDYRVCMELTDKNSSGNSQCIDFAKSASSQTLSPADASSFDNVSITWTPESGG